MGMFDGIEEASTNQGGAYLLPGKHRLKIVALKTPEKLRSGDCFIAELEVVETSCEEYAVGQSVSWVRNITKHKEMALADIKAFLAAAAGIEEDEVDSKGAKAATSESQPLAGKLVDCEAFNKSTQAARTFTRTLWSHPE